ncbi:MAG: hypothetical protein HC835_19630 [Oscillatoriales cyanobacterium RM2_1_1]|nr:hypothetical protein [Oscillatoriales cyanobacterium SM2_3_0]NJO47630.1 hypothetical protein [Oscillatoriales cyanobacterium RM2_1_1]
MTESIPPICTLISLVIPPNCKCEKVEPRTYQIVCSDFGTAMGVWERRFESLYPLLQTGDMLEVVGEDFQIKSYPKP